jgi:hypothetical protein
MFLLALLTVPGWIIALVSAPALNQHAVIAEITQVPYMTYFAVVARVVSAVMSVATIYGIGRTTKLVAGQACSRRPPARSIRH